MGTGLLASLVTRGGKGHYHDDTAKRASACAEQAAGHARGGAKPDEAKALFASAEATGPAQVLPAAPAVPAATTPSVRQSGRRGRRSATRSPAPVAVAAAPTDPWRLMVEMSAAPLKELTLAVAVDQRRAGKDLNVALTLCPTARPLTRQLALSCGTAQRSHRLPTAASGSDGPSGGRRDLQTRGAGTGGPRSGDGGRSDDPGRSASLPGRSAVSQGDRVAGLPG